MQVDPVAAGLSALARGDGPRGRIGQHREVAHRVPRREVDPVQQDRRVVDPVGLLGEIELQEDRLAAHHRGGQQQPAGAPPAGRPVAAVEAGPGQLDVVPLVDDVHIVDGDHVPRGVHRDVAHPGHRLQVDVEEVGVGGSDEVGVLAGQELEGEDQRVGACRHVEVEREPHLVARVAVRRHVVVVAAPEVPQVAGVDHRHRAAERRLDRAEAAHHAAHRAVPPLGEVADVAQVDLGGDEQVGRRVRGSGPGPQRPGQPQQAPSAHRPCPSSPFPGGVPRVPILPFLAREPYGGILPEPPVVLRRRSRGEGIPSSRGAQVGWSAAAPERTERCLKAVASSTG